MNSKAHYIEFFRDKGFNCFPINRYPDSKPEQKGADGRYKAADTIPNQAISPTDNYGIIPTSPGSAIIDLDHKELFRQFAEENIKNGFMVIETPNGWHIPIVGFSGEVQKMMLYNYAVEPEKQIIDIQGPKQYVIGPGCDVYDKEKDARIFYENKGSETIWDAKGLDFSKFIDFLCKRCEVVSKKVSRGAHYSMRQRFKEGKLPTRGTSNDYFFNAAMQCNSDEMAKDDAIEAIRIIYDKWVESDHYTHRPWDNILTKIDNAYELEPLSEGRPKEKQEDFAKDVAKAMLADRKIYSDQRTDEIFEDKAGYLENITHILHKDIQSKHESLTPNLFREIMFSLVGLAPNLPDTDENILVFDNGKFNTQTKKLVETDKLAEMGFKGYNYLSKSDNNTPTKFLDIMFSNVPESEHPRVKMALRAALKPKLDPRISVVHGRAGVGKSLGMTILLNILNKNEEYAMTVELSQLLTDHFIKAKIRGKTLLILTEMPETYNDFAAIKAITGEQMKTERGFHQDAVTFTNKLKIIGSTNYLAKIPDKEQDAMYSRRLSLIHNVRQFAYKHDPDLADTVVKEEGEKIISWILNLEDSECEYEDAKTVRREWENLSSPELEYMQKYWRIGEASAKTSVMLLKNDFEEKYDTIMPFKTFLKSLESQGYAVSRNMIDDLVPVRIEEKTEQTLG